MQIIGNSAFHSRRPTHKHYVITYVMYWHENHSTWQYLIVIGTDANVCPLAVVYRFHFATVPRLKISHALQYINHILLCSCMKYVKDSAHKCIFVELLAIFS